MSDEEETPGEREAAARAQLERILAEQVYTGDGYKPFSEMTRAQVEARAAELRRAADSGPLQAQKVAPVASVWEGLAEAMSREAAATVADLDEASLLSRADRLGVIPPGGSFL